MTKIDRGLARAEGERADLVLYRPLYVMVAARQGMCQYYRNDLIITSLLSLFLERH